MVSEHPYSEAFDDGTHIFVSGSLSVDGDGLAVDGRRAAIEAALDKLDNRLATVGFGLSAVVYATFYVTDISLRSEINVVFSERFGEPRPARSVVGVRALPYGATVEVMAIASRNSAR